jgi:hypothetical protein
VVKKARCGINETRWHCSSQEEWIGGGGAAQHTCSNELETRRWCEMKSGAEVTKEPREKVLHKDFDRALPPNNSWFVVFAEGSFRKMKSLRLCKLVYLNLILLRAPCSPHLYNRR